MLEDKRYKQGETGASYFQMKRGGRVSPFPGQISWGIDYDAIRVATLIRYLDY